MQKVGKVSTIIPTVNATDELALTITSIKNNSDLEHEIIIVVDPDIKSGRIENKIIDICKAENVRFLINDSNLGPYGSWNKGAKYSSHDWIIFATDDQYFAPGWDSSLIKSWKSKSLVSGRLVEPGVIPVFKSNIKKDFGTSSMDFEEKDFLEWVSAQKEEGVMEGGFFIPMLQKKSDFQKLGGYPTSNDFGTSMATSNDISYIDKAKDKGYKHITALGSYSYHFQASSWKKKSLKPKVAAIILTHNSERHIKKTLDSLAWVNKIVIVDSGSTDSTLTIAKKYSPTVYKHALADFSSQRNYAIGKTKDYDWVLMVDSDEEIEKDLSDELISFSKDIYLDGVYIPRMNYIFGKWVRHSDWYPDHRLVFFRPDSVVYTSKVHERAEFKDRKSRSAYANNHIIHYNYESIDQFLQKNLISYPKLYAMDMYKKQSDFRPIDLIREPLKEFMRRYFLTEGYRDGVHGLILSLFMAAQSLATYSYLWELKGSKEDFESADLRLMRKSLRKEIGEFKYWLLSTKIDNSKGLTKVSSRIMRKIHKTLQKL